VTTGWHLVRTKPMSEYLAALALERNGYELYFPLVQTPRPRSGHADTPLFPGYLFIRQDRNGSGLPAINRIAGLIGWVQFDDVVPTVPDAVIAELVRRVGAINQTGGHWRRYRPGERVSVNWGSTESLAEVLEEPQSPESRVSVLLDFMGRLVRARVPWQDLHPASDDSARFNGGRPPRRTRGNGRWVRGFRPSGVVGASTSRG
jgi:transcriptional antiterminator RfaH